jgi:hypothetical protein
MPRASVRVTATRKDGVRNEAVTGSSQGVLVGKEASGLERVKTGGRATFSVQRAGAGCNMVRGARCSALAVQSKPPSHPHDER